MRHRDAAAGVPSEALQMINAWTTVPAFIRDRYLTVLASNVLAKEVSPILREGVNLVRAVYSGEALRAGLAIVPRQVVDTLKASVARYEWDADFEALVDEVSSTSPDFVEAWHDPSEMKSPRPVRVLHTRVGSFSLASQAMTMPGKTDLSLAVLRGTDPASCAALTRLTRPATPNRR